jgi:hypothetical protein
MIRLALVLLFAATPALAQDAGLEVWSKIHEVFSHPRCTNCHVGEDNVPIWSGQSYWPKSRPHGMNINGGPSRKGADGPRTGAEWIPCNSCHTKHNSPIPHGPPGAEDWALPPESMQWLGKSSAQICAQVQDKSLNGGLDFAGLAKHLATDGRVLWAWDPGPGRDAAPYSSAKVVEFLWQWEKAGAPCPTN